MLPDKNSLVCLLDMCGTNASVLRESTDVLDKIRQHAAVGYKAFEKFVRLYVSTRQYDAAVACVVAYRSKPETRRRISGAMYNGLLIELVKASEWGLARSLIEMARDDRASIEPVVVRAVDSETSLDALSPQ